MNPSPVYEMLWDCRFCGKKKLLGLTHRYCPSCGAPQNAEGRYFPSEAEKVLAQDHEYRGADLVCRHCGEANGRAANNCRGCGAPLEGSAELPRRPDQVQARAAHAVAPPAAAAPKKRLGCGTLAGLGCLSVLALAGVVAALWLTKRDDVLTVSGHTWRREIVIEQLSPVSDSAWCDDVPAGAMGIRRAREVRSHKRVQDGENCVTRKVDRGNGTFVEEQQCTPRYREEDVYDDKCTFTVNKWHPVRSVVTSGASGSTPAWGEISLARSGDCDGCERTGERKESYVLELISAQGDRQTCDFDPVKWASFQDGSRWTGRVRVLGGSLDCASLTAE